MDIEEYRPDPPRSLAPPPRPKDHSVLIMSVVLVGTFIGTIAFQERHEIADYAWQHYGGGTPASQAVPPPTQASIATPSRLTGLEAQGNVERAMTCIPANVFSPVEIEQLNRAIAAIPASSTGTTTKRPPAESRWV